jgi:hypothetical protein
VLPAQEGSDARATPGGPLFALVSCPNYTAEVLSWVGFSIMTQIGVSYAFTVVGAWWRGARGPQKRQSTACARPRPPAPSAHPLTPLSSPTPPPVVFLHRAPAFAARARAAGFLQMAQWALQKHRGYLVADPSYKKLRRRAIVPFLL